MSGALALVGSGEYTSAMNDVDRALMETLGGAAQARVVVLPTASGLEPGMPERWNAQGVAHFGALGAAVTPVPLVTRADAHDQAILDLLADANFFYLSGGNPQYAVETWRDSPAWAILCDSFAAGAVVAGCSAGAMMLGEATISVRRMRAGEPPQWEPALGLIGGVATMPHFDRMRGMLTDTRFRELRQSAPDGMTIVGVDEDTALVHFGDRWQVLGRQSVTVFDTSPPAVYPTGAIVPPLRGAVIG